MPHLGKVPGNAAMFLLHLFDRTLQPTICECVLFVELEAALVFEKAVSCLRCNPLDVLGGDNGGSELDKVLLARLQVQTSLAHHGELLGLADEQLEGIVLLVHGAQRDQVGVEVQHKPQPILSSYLRFYLLSPGLSLHLIDQLLVL